MKTPLLIGLSVIILVGLFFVLKPKTAQSTITPSTNQVTQPNILQPTPINTFNIVIKDKNIVSGLDIIKVNQGDEVTITITSDESEEFHIHGYDESVELLPDTQVALTFTATNSGRFDFELENSKTELGALEVQPK